jgi:hypothetical protein
MRALALVALLELSACIPLAITGTSQSVSYTFRNIAYRTFTYPKAQVVEASMKALKRMQIKVRDKTAKDEATLIRAETKKLTIEITIEPVTPKATKISINASRLLVLKDRAVAAEIINQVELALAGP